MDQADLVHGNSICLIDGEQGERPTFGWGKSAMTSAFVGKGHRPGPRLPPGDHEIPGISMMEEMKKIGGGFLPEWMIFSENGGDIPGQIKLPQQRNRFSFANFRRPEDHRDVDGPNQVPGKILATAPNAWMQIDVANGALGGDTTDHTFRFGYRGWHPQQPPDQGRTCPL